MSKEWQDAIGVANEVAEVYERGPSVSWNQYDKIIGMIKKAMDRARQDERKQIVRWVEIKIKDILGDKDYYNQFYGVDILVRTLKGIIDGIECCAWEDVDDSLLKKASGERGTRVSPDGSPAPRGADLTDEPSGSGSPAKLHKPDKWKKKWEALK